MLETNGACVLGRERKNKLRYEKYFYYVKARNARESI